MDKNQELAVVVRDLSRDERWALVNRVAASKGLAKAVQLRDLLLFLSRHAITAPHVELTEQEIGCRVLGRRSDYDTQADNIVRVQIRHLRQKLDEYYSAEGENESIVLTIPKGSRIPRFEPRVEPPPPVPAPPPPVANAVPAARGRFLWLAMLVLIALPAFYLGRSSRESARPPSPELAIVPNPLWDRLFIKGENTTIVIADSSLVFIQDMVRSDLNLAEYASGSFLKMIEALPEPKLREALREISSRQYTSMADATLASKLTSLGTRRGSGSAVRYARHMGMRDFNAGNFVLIGSKRGIPWTELFQPELNFQMERIGPGQAMGFRNQRPLPAEAASYGTQRSPDGSEATFATISFLPNLTHTGDVLLLDGIKMEATEAAGEFSMSSGFAKLITQTLGAAPSQRLPYFEVLLKVQVVSGAPHKVEVIASRKSKS